MSERFEALRALADAGELEALAKGLEQVPVLRLTREEQNGLSGLFAKLPPELVDFSSELSFRAAQLALQQGDAAAAQKSYHRLVALRDQCKGGSPQRRLLENRVLCTALSMPPDAGTNLLLSLAVLASECADAKLPVARLSATGKFPSVLRGAKDLSTLAKYSRAAVSIVRPLLPAFLEEGGAGVCEAAIAELLYERNDLNEASLQAATALGAQDPEIAFAALALMARIGAVDPNAKPPAEILAHIGAMLEKKEAGWLAANYKALCARFDMLRGNAEAVRAWAEGCGLNELGGVTLRDSYQLLTLAKAYIALGEYRNAATLLEGLTMAMEREQRTLDTIECLANGAIVCERMGNGERALAKLEKALLLGQEYGYIRVFADLGKQMFHLMVRYTREGQPPTSLVERYLARVTEAARIFSTLCPALYPTLENGGDSGEGGELTQSEVLVLQLLDEGKPNKAIAAALHVQPSTVNFHLKNIFEKLGATNRTEAVKKAREKGILAFPQAVAT